MEVCSPLAQGISTSKLTILIELHMTDRRLRPTLLFNPCVSYRWLVDQNGWPRHVPDSLKPYHTQQNEIGTESGCLMWGIRVIVPEKLQAKALAVRYFMHPLLL